MLFLVTILVVGDVCARAGVFVQGARLVSRLGHGRPVALMTGVFLLAATVTTVLSLDATVVLLMPVVVGAALTVGADPWPNAHTSLRMANSASLLLPVSNLTNLLALPYLGLSFAGFVGAMAPVLVAVLVVEYVALRWLFRRELTAPLAEPEAEDPGAGARFPVVVVGVMLVGFLVGGQLGWHPFWCSGAAAVVLVGLGPTPRAGLGPRRARRGPSRLRGPGARPGGRGRRAVGRWVRRPGPRRAARLHVVRRPPRHLGDRDRPVGPADQPLRGPAAPPDAGAARSDRRARGPARPQHRLGTDLDRVAGEPPVAARPAATGDGADDPGSSTGCPWSSPRSRCWPA